MPEVAPTPASSAASSAAGSPSAGPSPASSAGSGLVIVDPRGAPIAAASVVILDQGYSLAVGTPSAPLVSDAEGLVSFATEQSEPIALAWAPGHAAARLALDRSHAGRLVLPDATVLRGRVQGAHPIEHVWLQARTSPETSLEAPWPFFVRCDVDAAGRFRADGLAAGTFSVTSVPIGSAPVLAADVQGRVRLLGVEPGRVTPVAHRFLDREIVADGDEHVLRVVFGDAVIVGQVHDESGAPIGGAVVRAMDEEGHEARAIADASGRFELVVRPTPYVRVTAEHPDFGLQWTDYEWDGWSVGGPIPDHPIELVLRRGVELHGRVVLPDGSPFADRDLILVPAYVGSGPPTREAHSDARGELRFERMVLRSFELVPTSLRNWHPDDAGEYVRVSSPDPAAWSRAASTGQPLSLVLERFELVRVEIEVGAGSVQVWTRWGPELYRGSAPTVSRGRVEISMERGRPHELWVAPFREGESLTPPFARAPDWTGTPDGPLRLTL